MDSSRHRSMMMYMTSHSTFTNLFCSTHRLPFGEGRQYPMINLTPTLLFQPPAVLSPQKPTIWKYQNFTLPATLQAISPSDLPAYPMFLHPNLEKRASRPILFPSWPVICLSHRPALSVWVWVLPEGLHVGRGMAGLVSMR